MVFFIDIPQWGIVGPKRLQDRLIVMASLFLGVIFTLLASAVLCSVFAD